MSTIEVLRQRAENQAQLLDEITKPGNYTSDLIRDLLAYAEAEHAARHDANRALDHERKKHSKATNRVAAATEYATAFSQAAHDAESDRIALLDVVRRLVDYADDADPKTARWKRTLTDARALMTKMEGTK